MPGSILTTASNILCTHGGKALLLTTNTRVIVDGSPALLESDVHPVVACAFTVGSEYSPCVRIEWSQSAIKVKTSSSILVKTSIGKCINAKGMLQGVATIVNTQLKVDAQ